MVWGTPMRKRHLFLLCLLTTTVLSLPAPVFWAQQSPYPPYPHPPQYPGAPQPPTYPSPPPQYPGAPQPPGYPAPPPPYPGGPQYPSYSSPPPSYPGAAPVPGSSPQPPSYPGAPQTPPAQASGQIPGVDLSRLNEQQQAQATALLNGEGCPCGCQLTLLRCRIEDSSCPVSLQRAQTIVTQLGNSSPSPFAPPSAVPGGPHIPQPYPQW